MRPPRFLLSCLCGVVLALINSLVCWVCRRRCGPRSVSGAASGVLNRATIDRISISTGRNPNPDHRWNGFQFLLIKFKIWPAENGPRIYDYVHPQDSIYSHHMLHWYVSLWYCSYKEKPNRRSMMGHTGRSGVKPQHTAVQSSLDFWPCFLTLDL